MEYTLVAVVLILWLATTGRLVKAFNVLSGAPAAATSAAEQTSLPKTNTSSQTPVDIQNHVGWGPTDGRVFDPNPNSTFSDVRGRPIRSVPGVVDVENYR